MWLSAWSVNSSGPADIVNLILQLYECDAWFLKYCFLQQFWRPQQDSNHADTLSRQTGGSAGLEWRNPEMNEEVDHLRVIQVLFQTGDPTLQTAEPLDPLEGPFIKYNFIFCIFFIKNMHPTFLLD